MNFGEALQAMRDGQVVRRDVKDSPPIKIEGGVLMIQDVDGAWCEGGPIHSNNLIATDWMIAQPLN